MLRALAIEPSDSPEGWLSRKRRDQEARRLASMRMSGVMPVEHAMGDPLEAERDRLLEWAWPLVERRDDVTEPGDDGAWHVRLSGQFKSAPAWQRARRDLCYGKDGNCLADGEDTTCVEVQVAKRFPGWSGGWWNNYLTEPAPARWARHEVAKAALRQLVAGSALQPLFSPQKGIADVVLWKTTPEGLMVVAVECKCLKPRKDPVSNEQRDWMKRFMSTAGRDRFAVADWVRQDGLS